MHDSESAITGVLTPHNGHAEEKEDDRRAAEDNEVGGAEASHARG